MENGKNYVSKEGNIHILWYTLSKARNTKWCFQFWFLSRN